MFKLTDEAKARIEENREYAAAKMVEFRSLSNDDLVFALQLYMENMRPMNFAPGEPVYDATMWHIIVPEMARRILENKNES